MDDIKKPARSSKGKKSANASEKPVQNQTIAATAQIQNPNAETVGHTTPTTLNVESKRPGSDTPQPSEPKKDGTGATGHEPVNTPAGATQQSGASNQKLDSVQERDGKMVVTPEQRWLMIAEAAYYRAERRGFTTEGSEQDWFEAEKEICATYCTPEEQ